MADMHDTGERRRLSGPTIFVELNFRNFFVKNIYPIYHVVHLSKYLLLSANDLTFPYTKLRDWHFPSSVYNPIALGRNRADRHLRIIRSLSLFPYPFLPSILELLLLCRLDVLLQAKPPKTHRQSRPC